MQRGFSLVEISLVLVILGLLTGGILAGQSLMRAAELRAVATEYGRYAAATQSFREQYFGLPGDMKNAIAYWGAANGTPATCAITPSSSELTCNGDGDGAISYLAAGSNEMFRFWQHLANAGLIEGSYNGVSATPSPAGFGCRPGTNCPVSKVKNASWSVYTIGSSGGHGQWFDGHYGNALCFGDSINGGTYSSRGVLSPEEAWNLDTKMDDGKAAVGNVVVWKNLVNPGCTNNDTQAAEFVLTTKTPACALIFKDGAV